MRIPKPLPIFGRTTPDDVLEQLSHGQQQKTIAYELGVSPTHLNKQLNRERQRRGARNMAERSDRVCFGDYALDKTRPDRPLGWPFHKVCEVHNRLCFPLA